MPISDIQERAKYGRRDGDVRPPKSYWLFKIWWIDIYLGHGRMLEAALVFVKIQYALMLLLIPKDHIVILAFTDLSFPPVIKALPFLIVACIQFAGLCLNALGHDVSRWFRVIGATLGMSIWFFVLIKNCYLGYYAAGVNPWCTMGIVGSLWIVRRGFLGLPKPGLV